MFGPIPAPGRRFRMPGIAPMRTLSPPPDIASCGTSSSETCHDQVRPHPQVLLLARSFAAFAASPVNINSADANGLASGLHGRPRQGAGHRRLPPAHGPFKSVDQLASVKGIGAATVEKNRDRIQLDATRAAQPE